MRGVFFLFVSLAVTVENREFVDSRLNGSSTATIAENPRDSLLDWHVVV